MQCLAPGSASATGAAGGACPTATIEHVAKLSKDDVAVLTRSLAVEWKAILTTATPGSGNFPGAPERTILVGSPRDPDSKYWSEERQRKVRRLLSEPASPLASAGAIAALRDEP